MQKPILAFLVTNFGIIDRGAEVSVYYLVKYLSSKYDITIYARKKHITDKTHSSLNKLPKNIKIIRINSISKANHITNFIYHLHPKIQKTLEIFFLSPEGIENLSFSILVFLDILFKHYDLIFPHNGIWGAMSARFIRLIKGTPFIMRTTGGIEPPVARQKPNIYICETPITYDWYRKRYPNNKFTVIPGGVDIQKFSPLKKAADIHLQKPIYVCIAALIPTKRIDLAIKAVAKLKNGSLLVVGTGPLKKELNSIGRKLLGKKRFMLTQVTHDQIPAYYKIGQVFTLPSFKEPFGNVYIEAMATGLPVVAPNDRQRKFIIGTAGILCQVEDNKIYAKSLFKSSKIDYGIKPRLQGMKFSWDVISKKYQKVFDKLIYEAR